MNLFLTKLVISPDYKETEVYIQTKDEKLGRDLKSYLSNFTMENQILVLKTTDGILRIHQEEIIYMEVFQKELTVYHQKGKFILKMPLNQLLRNLNTKSFIQISKSTVINLNFLKRLEVAYSGNYFAFLQDKKVIISRRYFPKLKESLNLLGGEKDERA